MRNLLQKLIDVFRRKTSIDEDLWRSRDFPLDLH